MTIKKDKFLEECQIFNNDWVDVFTEFKKEMSFDIQTIQQNIHDLSLETKNLKENISFTYSRLNKLTEALIVSVDSLEEADTFVLKKTQEFKSYVDVFTQLEDKVITINNADVLFIIEEMSKLVGKDIKESISDSLQENDVIRKFKNISSVSKKIEEQLEETLVGLKELLAHCQKGNEDIYISEIILLKLMSVLRFLDRLSDKDREKIINCDIAVHENASEKIEEFLSAKQIDIRDNSENGNNEKLKFLESEITLLSQKINSVEDTIEKGFNEIMTILSSRKKKVKHDEKNIKDFFSFKF